MKDNHSSGLLELKWEFQMVFVDKSTSFLQGEMKS